MEFLKIILQSFFSVVALFISTKIIGNKQMSQLNMFDYINGITIGSIAADAAINRGVDFIFDITAIGVYTFLIWLISFVGARNIKLRRFFTGKSIVLMDNGKIFDGNFKIAKIDMNEFLTQCRINGYFNLSDIKSAVLEQNGEISFLEKSAARPVTAGDLMINASGTQMPYSLILDGHIMYENLKLFGKDEVWLNNELRRLEIGNAKDVFYAYPDTQNTLFAFKKSGKISENDIFQ